MHISLHLDNEGRWTWQLKDMNGQLAAVSSLFFESHPLAMANAVQTCRHLTTAPIYMDRTGLAQAPAIDDETRIDPSKIQSTLNEFSMLLVSEGLQSALSFLNFGIVHRYTAIYRLNGQVLENVVLIDKLKEILPANLASVPYSQSFCQFAIRDGYFSTENSAWDDRLDGHPAQGVMNSYHAFPLVTDAGDVLGTVCHFDTAALALEEQDFELLRSAARIVASWLSKN